MSQQTYYGRIAQQQQQQPPAPALRTTANVSDDYERWYTETTPSNRMSLALQSGIETEITWALDRLTRLTQNEQFQLGPLFGVIDALFIWPEWYATEGCRAIGEYRGLFAVPRDIERKRQHALESMFILRNGSLYEPNRVIFSTHRRSMPLILNTLHNLDPEKDENVEIILHTIEFLQAVGIDMLLPSLNANPRGSPFPPLQAIVAKSSHRTLIVAALSVINMVLSNERNRRHFTPDSPALKAAIRYLPLFQDAGLLETCLEYLYVHLSSNDMAKAFLLNPDMPSVLKLLVSLLLATQVEESVTVDIPNSIHTVKSDAFMPINYELTEQELNVLGVTAEPTRCLNWIKTMFVSSPENVMTQLEFWTLYRETFTPFQDQAPLPPAGDAIKNASNIFPHVMVMQDAAQRFVVKGIERRKHIPQPQSLACRWKDSACDVDPFETETALFEHVLTHISELETDKYDCKWSTCSHTPVNAAGLRTHLLTHLSRGPPHQKPASQSDTVTLPNLGAAHPVADPTKRPLPPGPAPVITYRHPLLDPPSSSLTALLCIRILFKVSFASLDVAPRATVDRFGFPGLVEDFGADEAAYEASDSERDGERLGRKAFTNVRHLMQGVRMRDEVLMSWTEEMIAAGLSGTT